MTDVFDTNILIDALNGHVEADEEYARYDEVLISRITWMEVLAGVKGDDTATRDFLASRFRILPIDPEIAEIAIQLPRTKGVRLPDAILSASARVHKAVLVTRNTRDFGNSSAETRVPYSL